MDNLWKSCELRKKKLIFHTLYIKRKNIRNNNNKPAALRLAPFGALPKRLKKLMVCLNPKPVKFTWYNKIDEKTGEIYKTKALRFASFWDRQDETTDWIPCGKCEGCRCDKANDNATKAYLESQNWPENAFLTLTYSNDNLPKGRTLLKRDLQLFWKRLRKHISPQRIKYLACGEY